MDTTTTNNTLKEQYEALKAEQPKLRIRDAAKQLNTSEAALVATGENVTRLEGDFKEMIREIASLGYVMALTRNDDVVHERKGVYDNVSFEGHVGLVLNPDIDLRLFMMHWQFGFAVTEGERKSLQFFDKSGEAVHKIYMTEKSNGEAYAAFVEKYKAANQNDEVLTVPYPAEASEQADADIDVTAFREGWLALKDTHDFYSLTRKYKVSRTQALRLAPEGYARQVDNASSRKMLELAAAGEVPVMVFAGSRGCIQIHTGTVNKLMEAGPWYNVMDPEFNLHLRETAIAATYIVRKPSEAGIVTSVEVFDAAGSLIVQFFGKRKPGIPELESWRSITEQLN